MAKTKITMSAHKPVARRAVAKSHSKKDPARKTAAAPISESKGKSGKSAKHASKGADNSPSAADREARLQALGTIKSQSGVELTEKIKELVQ